MTEKNPDLCIGALTPAFLKRLQAKNLELLLYFQSFCEKNGLMFYLCGGSCIGAARNGGFIPWDDDVDVFMPRKDYEKLATLWNEKADPKYRYCRTTESHFTRMLFGMVHDVETTLIKTRMADLDTMHGVRLDILPIDGCPKGKLAQWIQIFHALLYSFYINRESPTSKGLLIHYFGRLLLLLFAPTQKSAYRHAKRHEKAMSKYDLDDPATFGARELCARFQYMRDIYPKDGFVHTVEGLFEGHQMPLPAGYDAYLTMAYGDWRSLPPVEKQVPIHETSIIDLKNGYERYRGSYFPVAKQK